MDSSLQFLLQAMQALRRKNPLTQSFLVQLDLDIERAGVLGLQQKAYPPPNPSGPVSNHLQHRVRLSLFSKLICDNNQMDISPDSSDEPSPAMVNSGSTSHSSYPSGQQDEVQSLQYLTSPEGRSDKMPLAHTTAATNTQLLTVSEDLFSASIYSPPLINGDALNSEFIAGNDCDMSAMDTGMTPMSEGSWNRMLQDAGNLLVNVDSLTVT
jgi:hypothetical protein